MSNVQRGAADTETLILRAAEREFTMKGYSGAKTTAIAEAAGVTHAMLHYYFRTKEKLFEKILADKMEKLGEIMLGAIAGDGLPLRERIRRGIEHHFDFLAANRHLPRFIVNELAEHPERLETVRGGLQKKGAALLESLQQALDREGLAHMDARMILSDIISLNIFPFVAEPMIRNIVGDVYGGYEAFLQMRREENVKTMFLKLGLL